MANLRRISDGAGDSGGRSEAIAWNKDRSFKEVVGRRPVVGCSMLVGSFTARSYASQDYWLTTTVKEILEELSNDDCDYVKFSTGNSVYEWWEGVYPEEKNKLEK